MKMLRKFIAALPYPSFVGYIAAREYIRWYEGFSYRFERNGEGLLLERLGAFGMRTVFDVGANEGDWSKIALRRFEDAELHAFELSPMTFETLGKALANETRVTVNDFGLSDKVGHIEYKDYGAGSGANTIIAGVDFHDAWIKPSILTGSVSTGDAYCRERGIDRIDLLKIDVEGAEHLVLKGFRDMLEAGNIRVIQFEYGYVNGDTGFLMKDFYALLTRCGYAMGPLKPSGVQFMDFDYALNSFRSGPNFVAVHGGETDIIDAVRGKPIKGYPKR